MCLFLNNKYRLFSLEGHDFALSIDIQLCDICLLVSSGQLAGTLCVEIAERQALLRGEQKLFGSTNTPPLALILPK